MALGIYLHIMDSEDTKTHFMKKVMQCKLCNLPLVDNNLNSAPKFCKMPSGSL